MALLGKLNCPLEISLVSVTEPTLCASSICLNNIILLLLVGWSVSPGHRVCGDAHRAEANRLPRPQCGLLEETCRPKWHHFIFHFNFRFRFLSFRLGYLFSHLLMFLEVCCADFTERYLFVKPSRRCIA